MRFFNRRENPNIIAGLFLLVMLAVFAGPNTLPRLISSLAPFADEGVPCQWLRQGNNRAMHQSLIGREISTRATPPMSLSVQTNSLSSTPESRLVVSITIVNETVGPLAFLLTPNSVIVGTGTGENGLGIVFNSNAVIPQAAQTVGSYPEAQIHILGPRQRCIHRVSFPIAQLSGQIVGLGTDTVKAFYRNNSRGTAAPRPGSIQIYADQGLWTGVVESSLFTIPVSAQ